MCPCTNIFLSNCANVQLRIVWFPSLNWEPKVPSNSKQKMCEENFEGGKGSAALGWT